MVSVVFAILTLFWIPLDIFTFEKEQAVVLSVLRVIIAVIFLAVALYSRSGQKELATFAMLLIILVNPMMLHGAAHILFAGQTQTGLAYVNENLYEALPYVVVAGLAIFPLVVIEAVFLFIPILAIELFLPMYTGTFFWFGFLSEGWILGLILGIALLAGITQTYFMEVLLKRADYDPMTGALTRRSGTERIEFIFRLSIDKKTPLTVVFLDLDNFKSINDTYGHDAGDEALCLTVESLNDKKRESDSVIRWGGEEFVLLLPDTSVEGAQMVIDRILSDGLATRPDGGPLTASIGAAERITDAKNTWTDLVELADERMYEAKQNGKNRCVFLT